MTCWMEKLPVLRLCGETNIMLQPILNFPLLFHLSLAQFPLCAFALLLIRLACACVFFRSVMEKSFLEYYDFYEGVCKERLHLQGQNLQVTFYSNLCSSHLHFCKIHSEIEILLNMFKWQRKSYVKRIFIMQRVTKMQSSLKKKTCNTLLNAGARK